MSAREEIEFRKTGPNPIVHNMGNRKHVIATIATLLISCSSTISAKTPTQVVQEYVDAANAGDLERFLSLYDANIAKYTFPNTFASQGIAHMREVYTRSFAKKSGIHVEIISMTVLGDKVVSRDRVTGLPDGKTADELTIYQVEGDVIKNIVYVDKVES